MQTKSGLTLTYQALDAPLWSATAASITPAGTVHDVWMLTQQVDALGNGVIYQYTTLSEATQPDGSYGVQHLLTEIDYTVSGALSGGGQTPVRSTGRAYRAVQFTYEDRPDGERGWQGGRQITLLRRLQTITMLAPDPTTEAPVWKYTIGYETSSFSHRSLVNSVQRCALHGSATAVGGCLWKKQFSWTQAGVTHVHATEHQWARQCRRCRPTAGGGEWRLRTNCHE